MQKRLYSWIFFIMTCLLLVLLFGFAWLGLLEGKASIVLISALAQRTRIERLTKDVLILSDTPTLAARAQAVSEIQNTMSLWERTQNGLTNGDASLQLPSPVPSDIAYQMVLASADFVPMDTALQKIAAHPNAIDPVQVQVVTVHEYPYFLSMSQVNVLWRTHINDQFQQFFWIESALIGATLVIVVLNFWYAFLRKGKIV